MKLLRHCWARGFALPLLCCTFLLQGCFFYITGNFEDPALVLILPTEAELPGLPLNKLLGFRSQQQGPRIFVNSPQPGEVYTPPVPIDIRFASRDGSRVAEKTLKVIYVKQPKVDITERVAPYVTPDGIRVPRAELPEGEHTLILSIADEQGRSSSQMIRLIIKEKS